MDPLQVDLTAIVKGMLGDLAIQVAALRAEKQALEARILELESALMKATPVVKSGLHMAEKN